MAKLTWDLDGKRLYETGADQGVLFVVGNSGYGSGVAWDGLTGISENPDGAASTPKFANNNKYGNLISAENFKATISAFTYPTEWEACDGSASDATAAPGVYTTGQTRKQFGLSYRTLIGNDVKGMDFGYVLHLVYGATAAPSKRENVTVNDTPDMTQLSWDITTVGVPVPNLRASAHIKIKSTEVDAAKLKALEAILYGSDAEGAAGLPRLPMPEEVMTLLKKTT